MKNHFDQISFQIYQNQELTFQFDEGLVLFFGLNGTSQVASGTARYDLLPAGLLVINPFEIYRVICPMGTSVLCMRISRSLLTVSHWTDTQRCSCYARSGAEERREYQAVREQMAVIFQEHVRSNGTSAVAGSVMQLLQHLQSHFTSAAPAQAQRSATMQRLKRILDTIHARWNEDISLSEIAKDEYLSTSYLSRFFQKHLHMGFAQYLKTLRLEHAALMLTQTSASITHIAYDCGFHTPSAFIETFKQQYEQTPGQFRDTQQTLHSQQAGLPENDLRNDVTALLRYAPTEKKEIPTRVQPIAIDCTKRDSLPHTNGCRMLNIGYARDGLMAPIQEQIRRAQKEIGFEFIRFHGIFDEDMHIYSEDRHGKPQYCFVYVDLLFDFLLSLGLKPYVELSFMPAPLAREQTEIFDRHSIITGCTDLTKWRGLVQVTLAHFVDRYGREAVYQWKFTTISRSYMHLGCVLPEDHNALYCETWRAVKELDNRLQFGGPGSFAYLIGEANGIPLFLETMQERHCLPDFLSIQCYPHDQSAEDELFMNFTMTQQSAPAILSNDEDFTVHALDALEPLLARFGLENRDIFLEECTSTLWQRDLSSETCYKAVWMAKNLCESRSRAVFGYWLLTDMMEERATLESVFHGGYGLMTYSGIPKAGYQAMRLSAQLGDETIAQGEGWLLTRRGDCYQLLTYNYCHYSNIYRYRYQRLETPQEAYSVFEPGEILRLQFHLRGIPDGFYRVERQRITRQHNVIKIR